MRDFLVFELCKEVKALLLAVFVVSCDALALSFLVLQHVVPVSPPEVRDTKS